MLCTLVHDGAVSLALVYTSSFGTHSALMKKRVAQYMPSTECDVEVLYREKNIAEVLAFTVDAAADFFSEDAQAGRVLRVLQEVGLGYLRLGQPATELSDGEAQRVKLATELQRANRGDTLYVLDEPTTGLHSSDVDRLLRQLQDLVATGNTVIVVEHDMQVIPSSDWVIDMGPGAGDEGRRLSLRARQPRLRDPV